ncbi:MAG TPA: glycosyltransferase [Candidatus Binataceae bacterium]|nr:glycosyltransferase [Candidatus Binataceae bacterium]
MKRSPGSAMREFAQSPRNIVLFCPGLKETTIWGEQLAVISETRCLANEFPGATIHQFGLDDLDRIAAMPIDLLISYFTGPHPPWRVDDIADYVAGVTILKVVNHGDLLDEFAAVPVHGFMTNSAAAAEFFGKRRPAAYIPLAVDDDYGPVTPQDRYRADVVFLGSGGRGNKRPATTQHFLQAAKKFDFAIWGNYWDRDYWAREYTANPDANDWYRFWRGPLPLEDIAALYSSAKIVLNFHEDTQRRWGMWNNRVFEALGVGALMICDEAAGLREEFGDAIVYTSGGEETARLIEYFLAHPEERRRIGERGRRIVKERYVYSRWAQSVHALYDRIVTERRRAKAAHEFLEVDNKRISSYTESSEESE